VDCVAIPERVQAAVTLLVCLSAALLAERLARGLDLRAGAELDTRSSQWLTRASLADDLPLEVTVSAARKALEQAKADAAKLGLGFANDVILMA
jgi:hypothetical protein